MRRTASAVEERPQYPIDFPRGGPMPHDPLDPQRHRRCQACASVAHPDPGRFRQAHPHVAGTASPSNAHHPPFPPGIHGQSLTSPLAPVLCPPLQWLLPFLVNQAGSALFYVSLATTDLSVAAPVANATKFGLTAFVAALLGEEFVSTSSLRGGTSSSCFPNPLPPAPRFPQGSLASRCAPWSE